MRKLPSTAFKIGQIAHNRGLRHEAKLRGDVYYFTGELKHITSRLSGFIGKLRKFQKWLVSFIMLTTLSLCKARQYLGFMYLGTCRYCTQNKI